MKLTVDSKPCLKKPKTKGEYGAIQNRCIHPKEVTVNELKELVLAGHTIRDAVVTGNSKSNWVQQEVFIIDIDDGLTINEALQKYKHLNPFMIYTTFSHNNNHNKFRMLFKVKSVITDNKVAENIHLRLMNTIKECDEKCNSLCRLYFAGYSVVYVNEEAYLNIGELDKNEYKKNSKENKGKLKNCDKGGNNYYVNILIPPKSNSTIYNVDYNSKIQFERSADFYDYILRYNMYDIFNIPTVDTFNCILPWHEDSTPSAGIFIDEETQNYLYHCFACDKTLNNITLCEVLYSVDRLEAINILKNKLNIEVLENENIKLQKSMIDENMHFLQSEEFRTQHKDVYDIMKYDKLRLIALLDFAKSHMYGGTTKFMKNGDAIFYASVKKIMQEVFVTNSVKSANKTLQVLALMDFVKKIDPDDLPEDVLKKANKYKKRGKIANHFTVTGLSYTNMCRIDSIAKTLKKNNFTKKGMSRQYVFRTLGEDKANEVFPQEKGKKLSNNSNKLTYLIGEYIMIQISSKGYCSQKELLDDYSKFNISRDSLQTQFKTSVQEILDTYNLIMVKAKKDNKAKYNIPKEIHHNSCVIVKNNVD